MTTAPIRRQMRIAQVAPLYESVPPRLYGGTERVVSYLTEELVRAGHEVTLFASGDSVTSAKLIPVWDRALRLDDRCPESLALHMLMLEAIWEHSTSFDVIHFHTDTVHLPLARRCLTPSVTTLHGRLDLLGLEPLYREYADHPFVSISDAQRRPLSLSNWTATVHHGLPLGLLQPVLDAPRKYLAFLGRICPEKRVDRAIEIAQRTGIPLKIAAKVSHVDREYFAAHIQRQIDGHFIEYIGEIGEREKPHFLGHAIAMLHPIDWPEPFGLSMIEAMACGTPVIAFRHGSVPEVIDEGVTGYIAESVDEATELVMRARTFDRRRCRARFEQRFSAARMAREYCRIYEALGEEQRWRRKA
ncbi:MAG TPA: glycosyltransferase family 4 protein [Steroidobacteraceae bacterium]|nr:glycosyltransferase family 4 protein [Steroidobacteraceae bacterium]